MDSVPLCLMSGVPCPHQKAARIQARPSTFREAVSPTPTCIRPVNRRGCLAIIPADRPSLYRSRHSDYIEVKEFCTARVRSPLQKTSMITASLLELMVRRTS